MSPLPPPLHPRPKTGSSSPGPEPHTQPLCPFLWFSYATVWAAGAVGFLWLNQGKRIHSSKWPRGKAAGY